MKAIKKACRNKMKALYRPIALFLLCLCWATAVNAQELTGSLTARELEQWHTLYANGMSEDASWMGYRLQYEKGDTLFVKNTQIDKQYAIPKGRQGRFLTGGLFACLLPGDVLQVTNLESGAARQINHISDYQPVEEGNLLFAEFPHEDGKTLSIMALDGALLWQLEGVTDYALDESYGKIAYCTREKDGYKVWTVDIKQHRRERLLLEHVLPLSAFSWHIRGMSVAFAPVTSDPDGKRSNKEVFFYDLERGKLHMLRNASTELPKGMELAPVYLHDFRVADDGQRLFLALRHINPPSSWKETNIQIWNSLDKESYPVNELRLQDGEYLFSVWHPAKGTVEPIGSKLSEEVILTGKQDVALVYDFKKYLPTTHHHPDRDIYLKDLRTGVSTLFLERFSGFDEMLSISPGGKYIAYFREGDWWQYGLGNKRHVKVSRKEQGSLEQEGFDRPGQVPPVGAPMWTKDDAELLYYDQHDIWCYNAKSGTRKRLTKGKEAGMVFRFYNVQAHPTVHFQKEAVVDLDRPVVVEGRTVDHTKTGFFLLQGGRLDTIVYKNAKLKGFAFSKDRNSFRYMEQRSDLPPRLVLGRTGQAKERVVVSSNVALLKHGLGTIQQLTYSNSEGEEMRGLLYYPTDYDPQKKYPMVVSVYERQSHRIHDYVTPTLYNQTGFNPTLLAAEGYFVLCPDIRYTAGAVGMSAVDCVVAATEKAIGTASIDRKQIGLMGASFGGFETNFIISQTDLFAAAVSGSGMSDFISGYFSLNQNDKLFDSWRYTTHQPRMNASPFDNWERYLENSPLYHAQSINTPLLMWIGSNDLQVAPAQSMELFSAMRSLQKDCMLLVYEGEGHALWERKNQRNLTVKVLEWFGYNLKGLEQPVWALPF